MGLARVKLTKSGIFFLSKSTAKELRRIKTMAKKLDNQIEAMIRILEKPPGLNYNKALLKDYKLLGLDPWKISEFNEGAINKKFVEILRKV